MNLDFEVLQRMALSQLWQLTVVICVVGLLTHFLCRRRPHLAYVLWLIVLLKAVTPPVWSSPTGVFSWAGAGVARSDRLTASAAGPIVSGPDAASSAAVDLPGPPNVSTAPVEPARASEKPAAERGAKPLPAEFSPPEVVGALGPGEILGIVWLCGAAALGGLLVGRWSYYFFLLHHHRVDTDERLARLVGDLSKRLGVRRRVDVLVTTRPFGPAVCGLRRPTLILPQALVEEESMEHVRRIIAHELIHVRRGDNLVGVLQLFVQVIWWFHPLVWWTNRRMCVDREHCCDEQVVASLRCDPGTYAQSLLDMLKLRRQLRPALLPGVDAPEVTKRRLENLMDPRKIFRRRMPRVCWAMLVAGILFVVPGAGFTLSDEDAQAAGSPAANEQPPAALAEPTYEIAVGDEIPDLQKLINNAKPRSIVVVPAGTYETPIVVNKPIMLRGEDPERCILEVTADQPAVTITSRSPATIDSLTIRWQRATSGRPSGPTAALAAKDGKATVRNCRFAALGNSARSPSAVDCLGFSDVNFDDCRFDGFEFCINYTSGAEGKITDCVVLGPGHCGITVFTSSKIEVSKTIVTRSRYHGLRCTGGTLNVHDCLIIANKNRGIYLGAKQARGTIRNNVFFGNGTGISAFGDADNLITRNVFADSGYGGVDARDSCQVTVKNNIFYDNPRGFSLVREAGKNKVRFQKNTFWKNKENTVNVAVPPGSFVEDPQFKDPEAGNFTPQAKAVVGGQQGPKKPAEFAELWKKWKALSEDQ